jgi:hypothetical protein
VGLTDGFAEQKLTFKVQHPYDLKESERYSQENGVYHLWVRNTDKPFSEGYINNTLVDSRDHNNATSFYFKCGVYEQRGGSDEMHVHLKNLKLWSKS